MSGRKNTVLPPPSCVRMLPSPKKSKKKDSSESREQPSEEWKVVARTPEYNGKEPPNPDSEMNTQNSFVSAYY